MNRREQLLRMLTRYPAARYALTTVIQGEEVSLGMAIRNVAAFELRVPKQRYNAFALLTLAERYGAAQ